ncbi:DUF305 domain-containing protein [Planobispora siamensis]|uniref:DUF305 domain-containing protein n=1 Tax=Planobispora siamensis TaxID=936338 RepID=A0A8J3SJJ6_9ACTN|nr:DUF305 domain-containing protein [Planobispora siamensis]GIH93384.1 hypothetical protein Psi01_40140 [Planobispora siamensis]
MKRSAIALACAAVAGTLTVSACGAGSAAHGEAAGHGGHAVPAASASATPAGGDEAPAGTDDASAPAGTGASGSFNDADVMFLQMMIPHHRQGTEMAVVAKTRSPREEIRTMAAAIEATQGYEAETMTGWLEGWGQPLTTADPHAHDAHGGLHATSPAEIVKLRRLKGAAFDTRFLNVLVAHQHNAVEMARTEIRTGHNARVVELARQIEQSRLAQIKQMLAEMNP